MPEHPTTEPFPPPKRPQAQHSRSGHQGVRGEKDALQHSKGRGIHATEVDLESPSRKDEGAMQESQ